MSRYIRPFQEGDIVRLRNGTARLRVIDVFRSGTRWGVRARYLSDPSGVIYGDLRRPAENFIPHEQPEPTPMTAKLYQTLEATPRFGTFLIHNSAGLVVLEMKGGSNAVEAFSPSDVEEVRPYTVSATSGGTSKHYVTKKGAVEKGDVIITSRDIMLYVNRLDTKSSKIEGTLRGQKVATTSIELPENATEEESEDA